MPRMVNGVGTRFYGQCDWRRDGSFQTTEWLVMMYVPVVPFKSLRIQQAGGNSYRVFEQLPLSLAQVLRTYAFALIYLAAMPAALIALATRMNFESDSPVRSLLQMSLLGVIAAAPFLALRLARRNARRSAGTASAGERAR